MEPTRAELESRILDFMTVVYDSYKNTTFSGDRHSYARSMAVAMGWIVKLRRGTDVAAVIDEILSGQTDKAMTDYWLGGEWGLYLGRALGALRTSITS